MPFKIENRNKSMIVFLSGEIDHHIASSIRSEIDRQLHKDMPDKLILDFSEVTFMDSSGIGLVMGRYKFMNSIGGSVVIQNPPPSIKKVLKLSGIDRLADICSV